MDAGYTFEGTSLLVLTNTGTSTASYGAFADAQIPSVKLRFNFTVNRTGMAVVNEAMVPVTTLMLRWGEGLHGVHQQGGSYSERSYSTHKGGHLAPTSSSDHGDGSGSGGSDSSDSSDSSNSSDLLRLMSTNDCLIDIDVGVLIPSGVRGTHSSSAVDVTATGKFGWCRRQVQAQSQSPHAKTSSTNTVRVQLLQGEEVSLGIRYRHPAGSGSMGASTVVCVDVRR
jgi:hypothetical protein